MSVRGKFVGKLSQKPKSSDEPKATFLGVALRANLNEPDIEGLHEACVILASEHLDNKEIAEQARFWNEGDLVQIEGEVLALEKCKCCGEPYFLIGAWSCSRLLS